MDLIPPVAVNEISRVQPRPLTIGARRVRYFGVIREHLTKDNAELRNYLK
jgi:hypothetical protein